MKTDSKIIQPHGGYRRLLSYQMAVIVFDATVAFCARFIDQRSRTQDQMVQAARSVKQNIAEGSQDSATSKRTELKLLGVARGSLEELLQDYHDFLRQRALQVWGKNHHRAIVIRKLAYRKHKSYDTYRRYVEDSDPETAANTILCLIHQAAYLLDKQTRHLEESFIQEGGVTERMYHVRRAARRKQENGRTAGKDE
jgi:restriction system protein